ncbi:U6 snRNA-associated Sm-like protein LSm2, partial [Punctularia strigosozonata HHB-11173 SS5]|uniref:U6 snRNA-associated Sm-like protein LSm2 n=1 Tax=Punctularia strigosozonata (strain HHB-11173) TaxID=741275 RepID=UPI0004417D2B
LIFSVFKTLTDQRVTVELKNDLCITGTLKSVDQFLNIRLDGISVLDEARHPHMMAVKNCFIRGSVVRYVQLPAEHVDTQLLEDATRRGASRCVFEFNPHSYRYSVAEASNQTKR